MTISIECAAKINEYLLVGPKDERGYHPLRTLFQTVGLFDTLTVSTDTDIDEFVSDADIPANNTVTKAWRLLGELVALPPLRAVLIKRIPMQSGLGGGSSDAAGFLRAMRWILPSGIGRGAMLEIAQAVGADVPFLLCGGRAIGEGYGERLTAMSDPEARWLVLAQPDIVCSTPAMYARLDQIPRPVSLKDRMGNDFERVAPAKCLQLIGQLRDLGCMGAALTGSGSAVFGYSKSEAEARRVEAEVEANWKIATSTIGEYE